ncbi:MAG: ATP-binding cassette domain-containing protein [Chitinophagaceae bacterium]|nr:ATP-binding cassette domain-containing protein [Chitinophagaceae bacterium]
MLKFSKVRKQFNSRVILDIPTLDLDSNLYWVQGQNGSGKSTFLRMVAGIIPFDGQIAFGNVDSKLHPVAYRQNISWADAEPLYPPFLSGQELLEFYVKLRGTPVKDAQELIDRIGIREFIDSRTGTYSSGTLKKLSLLLAFVGSPPIILLDEPLVTLDTVAVKSICDIVKEMQLSGSLLLVSSHLEHDALVSLSNKRLHVTNHTITLS